MPAGCESHIASKSAFASLKSTLHIQAPSAKACIQLILLKKNYAVPLYKLLFISEKVMSKDRLCMSQSLP
ncbi:hypothetical protein D770_15340 [Flammeovirgaceae bacterium 311]|nr:hypothetical protein D770_15340 [Flammeovirgaceae bacterium 311]